MPRCPFPRGQPRVSRATVGGCSPTAPPVHPARQHSPPICANTRNARKSVRGLGAVRAGQPAPERRYRLRYKAAAARPSRSAELRQPGDRQVVWQRRHHGECRPRLLSPSVPRVLPGVSWAPRAPGRAQPGARSAADDAVLALPLPGSSLFPSCSLPGSQQPPVSEHPLVPVARRPPASPAGCGDRRSDGHVTSHPPPTLIVSDPARVPRCHVRLPGVCPVCQPPTLPTRS